jgi:signal transduction histidine kinase
MSNFLGSLKNVSRREVALAFAFALVGLGEIVLRDLEPRTSLLVLALLTPLPLVWRVRFPLEVMGVSLGILINGQLVAHRDDFPVSFGGVALVAAYSAAAHLRGRRADAADFLVIAAIVGSVAVAASKNWHGSLATNVVAALISLTILFRGAWFAGRWMQGWRDRERAEVARREDQAHAALREERERIARELHDVLAHAISVIVLQARGARHSLRERPDDAREAVDAIERTASLALTEMRGLLGVLRADEQAGTLAPQPSLAQVGALVAEVRDAGLPVELRVEGEPHELPDGVALCAYRIVQEALTNTLKHAGPATARVLVRYADGALELEVADTGSGVGNGGPVGQGLTGMRERVAIFGGRIQTGPRREGGYLVTARLPL